MKKKTIINFQKTFSNHRHHQRLKNIMIQVHGNIIMVNSEQKFQA
jgi:hypothetical protein